MSSSVYLQETESTSQPESSLSDNVKLSKFQPVAPSHFHWGPVDSSAFCQSLDSAYQEAVHWKKNNFEVPRGSVGKQFVSELARLFRVVGEGSALESIALKAVFVACGLLLQKPSRTSKPKEHSTLLERHLQLWHEGKIGDLVSEGRAIQSRLPPHSTKISDSQLVRSFANLMFEGKTSAALKLITGHQRGCLFQLNDQIDPSNPNCLVRDILKKKHPPAQPLSQDCLISEVSESAPFHPIILRL